MKKISKIAVLILLSLSLLISFIVGYYIHSTMSLKSRIVCATGGYPEGLSPLCSAHINYFLTGETPEGRERMSANLYFLVNVYFGGTESEQEKALKLIDLFLLRGADVNYPFRGLTPLHRAAYIGSPALVRFLIQRGARPNILTSGPIVENGLTSLELARKMTKSNQAPYADYHGVISILEKSLQTSSSSLPKMQ